MTKIEVFKKLVALNKKQNDYIDRVPSDISAVVFDNEYINIQGQMMDLLIQNYFGDQADSIYWFLYDWKPGYSVEVDGQQTMINNIDEYIAWMKAVEFFE